MLHEQLLVAATSSSNFPPHCPIIAGGSDGPSERCSLHPYIFSDWPTKLAQ